MGNVKQQTSLKGVFAKIHSRLERLERTFPYPRYTTANLPDASLLESHIVYDTTVKKLKASDGTNWQALW